MERRIYLDYNATTPLRPGVADFMHEILGETGNPSSIHSFGRQARSRLETAREQIAALVDTHPNQVVFTGGATESNNTVLQSFKNERVLISAIEHPSVRESAPHAETIPVTADGVVDLDAFETLLEHGPAPALISVMLVNNETGVIQPLEKLAKIARKKVPGVHLHTDAVQAAGKIPLAFAALQVDYMSLSSHKIGGPQGAGALITAPGAKPVKLLYGGGQERGFRAGTENIAALAGFGVAATLAQAGLGAYQNLSALRDDMESRLRAACPDLVIAGKNAPRVANTSSLGVPHIPALTQLLNLDLEGIAVSSGSACSSGTIRADGGLPQKPQTLHGAIPGFIRVSLGWDTTPEEIDSFVAAWSNMVQRLKEKEHA